MLNSEIVSEKNHLKEDGMYVCNAISEKSPRNEEDSDQGYISDSENNFEDFPRKKLISSISQFSNYKETSPCTPHLVLNSALAPIKSEKIILNKNSQKPEKKIRINGMPNRHIVGDSNRPTYKIRVDKSQTNGNNININLNSNLENYHIEKQSKDMNQIIDNSQEELESFPNNKTHPSAISVGSFSNPPTIEKSNLTSSAVIDIMKYIQETILLFNSKFNLLFNNATTGIEHNNLQL